MSGEARSRPRRALITGISGQDGSYLAELLLAEGYEVVGLVRPGSAPPQQRLGLAGHLAGQVALVPGDLRDAAGLVAAVAQVAPDELYHLAGPSFIPDSWRSPGESVLAIAAATATLLGAVRDHVPQARVYVAGSGLMFGDAPESPQTEDTPCVPLSPYAASKLAAHQLVGLLRDHDDLFACTGITYNHESERRPAGFVTRKVTRAAAAIALGRPAALTLGDLDAVRDWSYAGDVVRGAWLALQQERPRDYILASGVGRTVRELVQTAFACVDLDPEPHLRVDPALVRPPERTASVGDPSRARRELGWEAQVSFAEMLARMVAADLRELEAEGPVASPEGHGAAGA